MTLVTTDGDIFFFRFYSVSCLRTTWLWLVLCWHSYWGLILKFGMSCNAMTSVGASFKFLWHLVLPILIVLRIPCCIASKKKKLRLFSFRRKKKTLRLFKAWYLAWTSGILGYKLGYRTVYCVFCFPWQVALASTIRGGMCTWQFLVRQCYIKLRTGLSWSFLVPQLYSMPKQISSSSSLRPGRQHLAKR